MRLVNQMADAVPTPVDVWTGARLRGAPRALSSTLLTVESAAVVLTLYALVVAHLTSTTLLRFGALVALGIGFEEIARRVGRLRLLINTGPHPDMTSVWTFAGALVLPAGYAAVLAVIIGIDIWTRQHRASGNYTYRLVYSTATVMLACLTATAVRANIESEVTGLPHGLTEAMAIVVAAIAYTIVNRLLIMTAAQLAAPERKMPIVGSGADNALELATLCLGVMTAIVLLHQPALSVLVLLPMALLQRAALVKELEAAASIDSKTGLLNSVAWQQAARRELARVDREEATAGLLLIDLDHFKLVNDTYGHLVGDAALHAVGARFKHELRQYDVVGRFGGEEFVALLPRLSADDARATAERIRASIESIDVAELAEGRTKNNGRGHMLAASVGLALFPDHGAELDTLLQAADVALYLAKSAGRNRVMVATAESRRDTAD
ncbi:MAG: hypothetical protein QOG80_3338 [Pseudonocardiales bacterium]|nr:hypothetical protein [Pseudonocardiales bacterium]